MNENFITEIKVNNLRCLNNLDIKLSEDKKKHLILTGRNGSGKSTLLEGIKAYCTAVQEGNFEEIKNFCDNYNCDKTTPEYDKYVSNALFPVKYVSYIKEMSVIFNNDNNFIRSFQNGDFVVCYLNALRDTDIEIPTGVEKITLDKVYNFDDEPHKIMLKYMLHLCTQEAFAKNFQDKETENAIREWRNRFEKCLQKILDNDKLKLNFYFKQYDFRIQEPNKPEYNFVELPDGYASIIRIFTEIMLRMERNWLDKGTKISTYDMNGIVLIDEIDAHLHIEIQKKILPVLIELFPNIQFIVTTHSPFILNSVKDAIIYDLENNTLVNTEEGLSNIPYEGVVEGYFGASQLSDELHDKFERYKVLFAKKELTDDDIYEIIHLEGYLDKIPDFLALDIMVDYKKMKLELMDRME
jgi:predicted ATPase